MASPLTDEWKRSSFKIASLERRVAVDKGSKCLIRDQSASAIRKQIEGCRKR